MSGEFGSEFSYDASSRRAILEAIDISDPDVCKELIADCEAVSRIYLDGISYYGNLLNMDSVDERITRILDLAKRAYDLTMFDDQTEIAKKFWRLALADSSGNLDESRWDRFIKLTRSIRAAHHLLRRASERKEFESKWREDNSERAYDLDLLKQISCVYFHVLKPKPGRSKSTIGPFVRFAWAAMRPVLGPRMPTIDSLNNRWARLRYDPTKTIRASPVDSGFGGSNK
jgi:hypothetical protein